MYIVFVGSRSSGHYYLHVDLSTTEHLESTRYVRYNVL